MEDIIEQLNNELNLKSICQVCSVKIPNNRVYSTLLCRICKIQINKEMEELKLDSKRDEMIKQIIDIKYQIYN